MTNPHIENAKKLLAEADQARMEGSQVHMDILRATAEALLGIAVELQRRNEERWTPGMP